MQKTATALALIFLFFPRKSLVISVFAFASMTPFGMAVGSYLAEAEQGGTVSGVFTALAPGSFIYVAIVEVIVRELNNKTDRFHKLFSLAFGYGIMSALALWV